MFSSGTTDTPKCVQVPGSAILLIRQGTYHFHDRFSHANNTCFDGSLFDIWVSLTIGATVIVIRRETILNPQLFAQLLIDQAVTVVMVTASLLAHIVTTCRHAFRNCRVVMTAGETPNVAAVRTIMEAGPPERLVNVYGPTESGVFTMTHDISRKDALMGQFPVGHTIEGAKAVLVDEFLNIIHGPGIGEILLGGIGLSRGYYSNPSKTQEDFVELSSAGEAVRLFRTADVGERDNEGRLFWRGRKSNEIKYHGYRINLDILESELCKLRDVTSAAAFRLDVSDNNRYWIIACLIARETGSNFREKCQREAKAMLPAYMVFQIYCLDRLPVNANGKANRAALATQVLQHMQQSIGKFPERDGLSQTEEKLRKIWHSCLGPFRLDEIEPHSDFILLGATSLDVASALSQMRHIFNVSCTVQMIYEHPTLRELAAEIDNLLKKSTRIGSPDLRARLMQDTHLADNLEVPTNAVSNWMSHDEGKVLITGVTGFVGAFLLKALVALPAVKAVRCLVRASTQDRGRQRILDTLSKYQILVGIPADHLSEIAPVCGNFTQPKLGLDEASFADLAL